MAIEKEDLLRVHHLFAAAAAFAICAAQASAATQAAQPASTVSPGAANMDKAHDPNRIICRYEEEIGTRLGGHKTCHTWAEWEAIARTSSEALSSAQIMADHMNPPGH